MRYKIKNLSGDTTNANPAFWQPICIYATSDHYQSLLPIGPGQTVVVGENAFVELTTNSNYAQFISVIDSGEPDLNVPYRITQTLNGSWQYVDLQRFAGKLAITNPSTATQPIYFSFSWFNTPATTPPAETISTVLPGETVNIDEPMSPIRFIALEGPNNATAYVLSN